MKIDLSFPHRYTVRRVELPSGKGPAPPVHYLPEPTAGHGSWSDLLEIAPEGGRPWIGAFSSPGSSRLSAVFSTPDPSTLLVIATGEPYLVKAADPKAITVPPCMPVIQAMPIHTLNMIVLADFTDLVAIGSNGVLWQSGRLTSDDLKIVGLAGGLLKVTGFIAWETGDVTITVDPATGRVVGKAYDF